MSTVWVVVHTFSHTNTHTSMHTHRGSCGVLGKQKTWSLIGTYCTIPKPQIQANTHIHDMDFLECAWQTVEKEFKGTGTRRADEEGGGGEEVTCSQSVVSFQGTSHLSSWWLTCKRPHKHSAVFALHGLCVDVLIVIVSPYRLLLLPSSRRGLVTKHSTDWNLDSRVYS